MRTLKPRQVDGATKTLMATNHKVGSATGIGWKDKEGN